MLALRQLEFKSSFPSQKLKQAHGEAVCSVLEFLTDKALAAKGFKWGVPVYLEAGQVEETQRPSLQLSLNQWHIHNYLLPI